MKISLTTLSKRRDDVLDGKEVVAHLLPAKTNATDNALPPFPRTSAQGLWADRDDITDPTTWVREQRELRRHKRIVRHAVAEIR